MMVIIFRSRLRPDADLAALERDGARMYELASAMPGFVAYKEYTAADGESLTLVHFADEDSLRAWRNHPEHLQVQQAARERHMSEYHIQVCTLGREYRFDPQHGRRDLAGGAA